MSMASLHGRFGGKRTKKQHVPAESEAFALAVGCAMNWCKLRNSTHPDFFTLVAQKVKELEGTLLSFRGLLSLVLSSLRRAHPCECVCYEAYVLLLSVSVCPFLASSARDGSGWLGMARGRWDGSGC